MSFLLNWPDIQKLVNKLESMDIFISPTLSRTVIQITNQMGIKGISKGGSEVTGFICDDNAHILALLQLLEREAYLKSHRQAYVKKLKVDSSKFMDSGHLHVHIKFKYEVVGNYGGIGYWRSIEIIGKIKPKDFLNHLK
ncbi:MAG: hypothetical protein ABIC04_07200 [Nanoarchaeota archaeon]